MAGLMVDLIRDKPIKLPHHLTDVSISYKPAFEQMDDLRPDQLAQLHDIHDREVAAASSLITSYRAAMRSKVPPIIEVSNVAAMAAHRSFTLYESFPNLAPPWGMWWMEYDHRQFIPEGRDRPDREEMFHGSATTGARLVEISHVGAVLSRLNPDEQERAVDYVGDADTRDERAAARWAVTLDLFFTLDRTPTGPMARYFLFLDEHGGLLDLAYQHRSTITPEGEDGMLALLTPFLYGLSLFHCRNVNTVEVDPEPRQVKRRRKQRKPPLLRFQMLKVDVDAPTRRPPPGIHRATSKGFPQGLHIVPGGFAHYGDCCPGQHEPKGLLFGRYEGMIWKPDHVRGSGRRGVIHTDYQIAEAEVAS